jgi:Sortase domain
MNKQQSSKHATTRQVPGRWLFAFPVLLLVAAGWFALHPWQSSASSPVGKEFSEDLYSPDRYRLLPNGMIEDTATGLTRKLDSAHVGDSPSAADIRAFISLTDDQRADLRDGVGPRPTRLLVGAIGVDAEVIPIGLDVNRALAVPRDAQITGWWSGGSVPGESGPTVIVGHFDSKVASGVFAKLQTLRKGASITIEDSEGSKYVYEVVQMEHLHKTAFPTEKVYGPTDGSTLRLVTCGGKFNRATGHYVDNTIAYAVLVSAQIVGRPDPAITAEDFPPKISPVSPVGFNDVTGTDEIVPDLSVEDFPAVITNSSTEPASSTTIISAPTFTVPVVLATIPPSTPSGVASSTPSGPGSSVALSSATQSAVASVVTAPPAGPSSVPVAPPQSNVPTTTPSISTTITTTTTTTTTAVLVSTTVQTESPETVPTSISTVGI